MLTRLKNFALAALAAVAITGGVAGLAYGAGEAHHDLSEVWIDGASVYFGTDNDIGFSFNGTKGVFAFAADDTVVEWGNGTNSPDVKTFGNIATAYKLWDASASEERYFGPARFTNHSLPTRYGLRWVAGQRGKPSLNADINSATEATREIADPDFEILGTNASSDDSTFFAEGGITFTTDGGGTDSVILLPHLDANQTAWAQVTWGTDKQTEWECDITTDADITACVIWAGLKLTNTATTTTDAKQIFFRYAPATNSGEWEAISSINNSDDAHDTNVAVAASTRYHLKIAIDSSRIGRFYINGSLVETSAALDNTTDLIPYIGILESEAVGKVLNIHGQSISRVAN